MLINPAVDSSTTLKRMLNLGDTANNYYDNSYFNWTTEHVDMLLNYKVKEPKNGEYFLLLQTGDDVLDYKEALAKLPNAKSVVEEGGTHSFEGIERHFEAICEFSL